MLNLIVNAILAPKVEGLTELENQVNLIITIILWAIFIIGGIILAGIGFEFMTAKQHEERQKLKSRLMWFGIGTGIVFLSATIWTVVVNVFGYSPI